jgi:prevent-host-death family protein
MKTVSIDALKRNLSSFIEQAAAGERIVITKHGKPVAALTAASSEHVRIGSRAARGTLKPALKGPTKGHYLTVLLDDRRGSDDRR